MKLWGAKRRMPIAVAAVTAAVGLTAAPVAHSVESRYVVMYRSGANDSVTAETGMREKRLGFTRRHLYRHALRGFSARLSSDQVKNLRADPEVAIVSPDRRVRALATVPVVTGDSIPPGIARIGAAIGPNVRAPSAAAVAIVDTGIRLAHADLNADAGVNCVSGTPNDDQNGHGTHVAGVIAARNNGAGVTGVAPGTRVVAVKVLGADGFGLESNVICGINWLVANAGARGIRVANMSFGYSDTFPTSCATHPMHAAVCNLAQAGVVSVAAAGNDGHNFGGITPDQPASYPEVLTVTGMGDGDGQPGGAAGPLPCPMAPPPVDHDDTYYTYSSYAVAPEDAAHTVAAPGVCVRSSLPDGTQESFSGTSAAAPHVSGTVALCFDEGGRGGPCAGLSSSGVIRKMVDDSARAATAGNGFTGDPGHPVAFRHYGFLVSTVESTRPIPVVAPPPPPAAPASPPKRARNRVRIATRAVRLTRGFVTVRVHCRGPARCRGTVMLSTRPRGRRKSVQLGRRRFSIAAEKTRSVRIRVTPRKRRLVRRAARIRARVTLQGGDPLTRILAVRHRARG